MAMDKKDQKIKPKPVQGKPAVVKPRPHTPGTPMDSKGADRPTKG